MKRIVVLTMVTFLACAKDEGPQPKAVIPGGGEAAPSDAVMLFDGKSMTGWMRRGGGPARCEVADGEMICKTGVGDTVSTEKFRDAQIHIEFNLPSMPEQKSQLRANSGVYLQGRYEIQVLDNFNNPTYANGHVGAVYGQHIPLANPSVGPGKWQTYDMVFHAPKCRDGKVTEPGSFTLLFNGILVQDHVPMTKATPGGLDEDVCQEGPLMLQDHSGFPGAPVTAMKFRRMWIRKL